MREATTCKTQLTITVTPTAKRSGRYDARLSDGRVLVTASKQPFVDAARRLIDIGYDPATVLVMRHPGSDTDCLTAQIGVAAKLRVKEDRNGPRFVLWEPFPRRVGAWAREKAEGIGGRAPDQSDEPSAPSGATVRASAKSLPDAHSGTGQRPR